MTGEPAARRAWVVPNTPFCEPSPFRHRVTSGSGPCHRCSFPEGNPAGLPMTNHRPPPARPGNRLLARLPETEYGRLLPLLQPVTLAFEQVLYQPHAPIDYAYFPT